MRVEIGWTAPWIAIPRGGFSRWMHNRSWTSFGPHKEVFCGYFQLLGFRASVASANVRELGVSIIF